MEKHEDVASILSKLDLHDIEEIITQPYHQEGPGRPPRSPLGIFKALIVKQLRNIPSDRELYRRLWNDEALRMICDIEEHEKPYHPSQLTRFRNRVGPERLEAVMNSLLEELVEDGIVKGETLALDATFIKAWSRRDTADDSRGLSDPEARVGRDGKSYDLGYKAHARAVERVNSRLDSVGLECLKLRGLRNAVIHTLLCVVTVLLVAVAALRLGRPWKARSLSSFWW